MLPEEHPLREHWERMERYVNRRMFRSILIVLREIEDYLTHLPPGLSPAVRLSLAAPEVYTQGGEQVTALQLKNTEASKYRILALDADGNAVAAPAGDTFTVASPDSASWAVSIDTMADGGPAVRFRPLVRAAAGLAFEVQDSSGLKVFDGTADIVTDLTPRAIGLDLTAPEVTPQDEPAA